MKNFCKVLSLILILAMLIPGCTKDPRDSQTAAPESTDSVTESTPGETVSEDNITPEETESQTNPESTTGATQAATSTPGASNVDKSIPVSDTSFLYKTSAGKKTFSPDPTNAVSQYDNLLLKLENFPIEFTYGSKAYKGFKGFRIEGSSFKSIDRGTETEIKLRSADINALFTLTSRVFPSEKAYEYVVNITNDSKTNTKVIKDLMFCPEFSGSNPSLATLSGDSNGQYNEIDIALSAQTISYNSTTGRPTHEAFPYYNLRHGNGGTFIAIGWPGTWSSSFTYTKSANKTIVTAGQRRIQTYIAPGENIRTPLMGFVEYENLSKDEQTNAWRHYYLNDVMPKDNGKTVDTSLCTWSPSVNKDSDAEASAVATLKAFKDNGLKVESIWLDAGWYNGLFGSVGEQLKTGVWEIDTKKFPNSMSDIKDYTNKNDIDFLLWFEPEVVRLSKSGFLKKYPDFKAEWLLECKNGSNTYQIVNLGNKDCEKWMFNKITSVIEKAGVDIYRQDFNENPATSWASADKTNRYGITENKYVQGYLSFWDSLLKKFPGLVIDSCASGGGRNDLETMKRSVPLHYTDWFDAHHEDYLMKAKMTQTLFAWFPYFKNQAYQSSLVKNRMNYSMFSMLTANANTSKAGWDLMKQSYSEFNQIRDYYYDDYYQLTTYSTNANRWNAWEFFDKKDSSGFAQFYCTEKSTELTKTFKLKGLDASKTYKITDFDGLVSVTATGKDLMTNGVKIKVPNANYCVITLIKPV